MLSRQFLSEGWTFHQSTTSKTRDNGIALEPLPVAQFPTVAQIDLLHHGLIPDPYIDANELDCIWVNDADWIYSTTFDEATSTEGTKDVRKVLTFDGLDTIVDVYLNDKLVLQANNMFVSWTVDVTTSLKDGENNLELRFRNAPEYARAEMERIGYRGDPELVHFGGPERLFIRKAQYHWGWDWGPALNTCGPWKNISLDTFVARIGDFIVRQEVSQDLGLAEVIIQGTIEGVNSDQKVLLEVADPDGKTVVSENVAVKDGDFKATLKVEQPRLWHSFMYGSQPLYTVTATIPGEDRKSKTLGLRRLKLLQNPLKHAEGTTFLFELNNTPIFCGGANWIPGDVLLPRMNRKRYEDWIKLAKAGNQTMIRVWGGGIVEDEDFYDICDKEGILVWQDLLFACGNYPATDDFCENVKNEVEQSMKRVGHHGSLAIWVGNNEDYMLADMRDWENDYADQEGPWDHTAFPARRIYERVMPEVHSRLGGDVPYWRSSPYGGAHAQDTTVGDTHCWDVWHGPLDRYQDYQKYTSRFISEFGIESCPDLRTMHQAITDPRERHSQSRLFEIHDKGPGHDRRYAMYMAENFRFKMNPLKDFVYCTQFLQAEAMKYAYNCWRREFRGPGEENCAGVIVWQLNDLWPGSSWALVDLNFNRKPAFFITKRALAKVVVGMERTITQEKPYMVTSHRPKKTSLDIWAVNGHLAELSATLKLLAYDIETGSAVELPKDKREQQVTLGPNRCTELGKLDIPNSEKTVIVAYLDDVSSGERLARWVSWPEPMKFIHFSPGLQVQSRVVRGTVVLTTNAPAKGVVVSVPIADGDDAQFDDNFIDLVPGEEVKIKVQGLDGRKLQVRWLCDWEQEKGFAL